MSQLAAIVLAGGQSVRLGGVDKLRLVDARGRTALSSAVTACRWARPIVVVGPDPGLEPDAAGQVITTCERPAGGGPARGLAAGLAIVKRQAPPPRLTLVVAGDMPQAGLAVPLLLTAAQRLAAAGHETVDGVIALADGQPQWLLGVYRTAALSRALTLPTWRPGQRGESVKAALAGLTLAQVDVPAAAGYDLDTWPEVAQAGFTTASSDQTPTQPRRKPMNEFDIVDQWWSTLGEHLDLTGAATPNWQDLLDTVRASAHGVIHAAGPVSAFAAGYAAAIGGGSADTMADILAAIRQVVPPEQPA